MKKLLGGVWVWLAVSAVFAAGTNNFTFTEGEADNGFALDLLKQVARGAPRGAPTQNVFISPYSVCASLQMLCNGAAGKTKTEIQRVLKTEGFPPDEPNRTCKELNDLFRSQTNVILNLANSIWVNKGFELKPAFVSANRDFFQAELASVNFQTPESADTINGWAARSTMGKINGVVSFPFPANTQVILANAIYFKGKWAAQFDKRLTRQRYFYLAGGVIKQTPMMSRHGKFQYEEGDGFQAVELPYAGNELQMTLFLPATNSSPQKLLADFNGKNWNNEIPRTSRDGTVVLPKFKVDFEILLNKPLEAMGMQQAFIEGAANFSAMSSDPLFVGEVKQKSYVDVNEEGTEAAAVTTVQVLNSIVIRHPKPFEMIVDRPFLFTISDTGQILFMGIVNDPTEQ